MNNKMLVCTDYIFYRYKNKLFSEIPWDEDFAHLFAEKIGKFTIIGRLRELQQPQINLHMVDERFFGIEEIYDFNNPLEILYPWNFIRIIKVLHQQIKKHDILFLKLFYFSSVLVFFLNFFIHHKPTTTLLVGDAAQAALLRGDYIKVKTIRKISSYGIYKLITFIQNRVILAGYVADFLLKKYKPSHNNVIVCNESWLKEWMYLKESTNKVEKSISVLFVGRLVTLKGVDLLVNVLIDLIKSGYELRGVIVGDGPLLNSLRATVEQAGLADKIIFKGWLQSLSKELINQYRECDLFVLPSYAEGLPLVILEAMANKCAVIATGVSGIPEIVVHEKTGLLIHPGQENEIKAALLRFIMDDELRQKCIKDAYRLSLGHSFNMQRGNYARRSISCLPRNCL